jgi:hypothetical protein
MDRQIVIERLNDLLGLESSGLLGRLDEVYSFVEPAAVDAPLLFEQILADEREHQRLLTEVIVQLDGVPWPRRSEMTSAGVHYLGASYLLPMLAQEKRKRVEAYEQAAPDVSAERHAAEAVARILSRHQKHLEHLEAFAERLAAAEAARPAPAMQGDDA